MRRRKKHLQTERGRKPSVMAAAEDGQEAHPQAACTSPSNSTSQAPAAFERRFFGYFFAVQKSNVP
jgi:hypothetical protein